MAIRQIAKMGHPVLRRIADPIVDPTESEIMRLAADMQDTLEWIGASGIAAPQVYESVRLIVYRIGAHRIPPDSDLQPIDWTVLVNPSLEFIGDEMVTVWERCLSLPGMHGKAPRHRNIRMTHQTLNGEQRVFEAHDWHATLLQHEYDHLDGILYPMRMTDLSLLGFNAEPGALAEEVKTDSNVDPLLVKMVDAWPDRDKWLA
jgi:peptide deformylase